MVTFDKIKIVAPIDSAYIVDPDKFDIVQDSGRVKSMRKSMSSPFTISIEFNYHSGEFILEFTGKVLGKRYSELISKETILTCFEKINELGYCVVDPAKMMSATVVKCDVTKDIPVEDTKSLNKWIKGNISNYQKYTCRVLGNGNLIVEKNVTTHKRKKRMTIYNKEKEMALSKEREFVETNNLTNTFSGLCRFELNLTSQQQIREALGITGNTLLEVLNSNRNPIADFMDEVMIDGSSQSENSNKYWKQYVRSLVLRDCNYDIEQVDARLREYYDAGNVSITQKMKPFREMLAVRDEKTSVWTKEKLLKALQ